MSSSDRKYASHEILKIKEIEKRFNDFLDIFSQIKELGIFEVDSQGFLSPDLPRGIESFGYTRKDVQNGLNALQLFIPQERMKISERISKVLVDVTQEDREYTALRKDRSTFPALIYSKPILKDGKPVGRRGICLDITDLKKTENALKSSNEELNQKSTELEEFVLRISHDLKTPLTSILGYISLIKEEFYEESLKELKFYLERIENNTKQMENIIEDIFDYSSIGRIREERKHYPLAEIIDEAINKFIPQLKINDIKIEVDTPLPKACVEKKRIIQVF